MSATASTRRSMADFDAAHRSQLDMLNIPEPLVAGLKDQLEAAFVTQVDNTEGEAFLDVEHATFFLMQSQFSLLVHPDIAAATADYGAMMVIPHIVSWEMLRGQGLIEALQELDATGTLQLLWQGLQTLQLQQQHDLGSEDLVNAVAGHAALWSRVILYRSSTTGTVRAALPAPPYLPQSPVDTTAEADCTGPFPFQYQHPVLGAIDVSLVYISPEGVAKLQEQGSTSLPTIDLVPSYQCPDAQMRSVRYAALLHCTDELPESAAATAKQVYAEFVHRMHLVRQAAIERQQEQQASDADDTKVEEKDERTAVDDKVYRIYTDANDPMQLKHPVAGLEANSSHFQIVDSLEDADIVYSYSSVFAPNSPVREYMLQNKQLLVNQFPFEGAFVQKNHLSREILKQHGLPRPSWALETYDLDAHLAEFVGAVLSEEVVDKPPLWIVKPAAGTQSQGHVVTRSLAHILRLIDAVGGGRVAQRYIERPVCIDGRKVDCRCLVLLSNAGTRLPKLYMHDTVYFRIANKKHAVATASDLADHESVLTATHLLDSNNRSSENELRKLPFDRDTITQLETDYPGSFDWNDSVLPNIQTMIRGLFTSMTTAFPAMGESKQSRALYGVDVMFQIDEGDDENTPIIPPKLTEVTFCPANNSVCDAYVRDEELFRTYNKDIFECLFLGIASERITKLQ